MYKRSEYHIIKSRLKETHKWQQTSVTHQNHTKHILYLSEFTASERLFLINPTMGGDIFRWHRPSWGVYLAQHSLVGDHVSVLPGVTMSKASGMVSDQVVTTRQSPHEGCRDASRPPAIVGLMRNSLSEALNRCVAVYYGVVKKQPPR